MPSIADMSVLSSVNTIAAYAPIPLFAESLRVQQALVSAVVARNALFPCLTGCIKDFSHLWDLDEFELLNQFHGNPSKSVVSIRHGNSFKLVNRAILDLSGITISRCTKTKPGFQEFRETVVNVIFAVPFDIDDDPVTKTRHWRIYKVFILFALETTVAVIISTLMALNGLVVGSVLLACVITANVAMVVLNNWLEPTFANTTAIRSDQTLTASGGAALDVQIIADHWNATQLNVLCGYSSLLHALTNIPVRTNRPVFLRWACRFLAIVLAIQAAALATVPSTTGNERWSSVIWLGVYLLMFLLRKALHFQDGPECIFDRQHTSMLIAEPLHFSGRRAALAFISTLPVSHRVDRWAWWDVFIPDNKRRREMQNELEKSAPFAANRPSMGSDGDKQLSSGVQIILEQITTAYKNQTFSTFLKEYEDKVYSSKKGQNV